MKTINFRTCEKGTFYEKKQKSKRKNTFKSQLKIKAKLGLAIHNPTLEMNLIDIQDVKN